MVRHAFTVEEADALLPYVREVLDELHGLRDEAAGRHDKLGVLDALWGEEIERPENPDHQEFLAHRRAIADAVRELERLVRQKLLTRGVRFPVGGIEHGLVDFPTTLDGRWVYLCWLSGEPRVTHWHEVDAGFAGRRGIAPEQRARIGRPDDPALRDDSVLDL